VSELISRRQRHRVRVLGELLGEAMMDQHGEDFLAKVEEIRHLAKARRQSRNEEQNQLQEVLKSLDDDYLISIARAFNQFLNLANITEQAELTANNESLYPDHSYLEDLFKRFKDANIDDKVIAEKVKNIRCELVLTAHPTEITRRTLIQKYNRIATQLKAVTEDSVLAPNERTKLERLIAEVWYTDEIRMERPTPQDEAKWGYAVIEYSFWDAIPKLWEGYNKLVITHTGKALPITATPIRISSWMGGDRDGNPNVTAKVTDEVIKLSRWMAADLYLRDLDELLSHLSMAKCNDAVRRLCINDQETQEPYRVVLRDLREALLETRQWSMTNKPITENLILTKKQLFTPLHICYQSLIESGMAIIAEGMLKDTLIRVSTFGVNLVDLDIRQNADVHTELLNSITEYLEIGSYQSWPERARQEFLIKELDSKRPLIPNTWSPNDGTQEALDTFKLIASFDSEGVSSYIISMAKNPSDVLAVVLLLRKCGVNKKLPVVPLFETLEDLENAAWTLERLLRIPWYTNYIEGHQQIMIGYSDSAKDAGQMAAAWAQYRAQEDLVRISEKYNVELTLFHGRGGTVGRGGAPARDAILSQPPGSVKNVMRVTEQGEVIRFKYGSPEIALQSLDLILSATLEASLLPPPAPSDNWRNMMDKMAEVSQVSYREVVQSNPEFLEYFSQGTPENELALLALGSRPARRPSTGHELPGIESLRAIPWVFAWTQKRLMLPAWLGTDEAFAKNFSGRAVYVLKEMLADWPFFRTQLDMLEMVLSKADADISQHYDSELVEESLMEMGNDFRKRMSSLVSFINELKGQTCLLENSPTIQRSLELRHPYTDPLHFLQIELLSRSRKNPQTGKANIDKALLITIAGIAAGMRNTG